ncbi:MAG: DUF6036 family nucleotidyltransferase [Bacteroidota bacterium]
MIVNICSLYTVNVFARALKKITNILNEAKIDYMLVGGFAVSFHNRARTTNDIDIVLQIYPRDVGKIVAHFPEWKSFEKSFAESVQAGQMFNITDFETGIRYDLMTYQDSDYNWIAFQRREQLEYFGITCYMCTKEDLIISKLSWYNIRQSEN